MAVAARTTIERNMWAPRVAGDNGDDRRVFRAHVNGTPRSVDRPACHSGEFATISKGRRFDQRFSKSNLRMHHAVSLAHFHMAKSYKALLKQYAKVLFVFGCHLILVVISVLGIYGPEQLFQWLWGHDEPLVFGRYPLKYLFQTIDVGIVAVFGYRGAIEIYRMLGD